MIRLASSLLVAAVAAMLLPTVAPGAELRLTEAATSGFPDRTYILTLPDKRVVDPEDVRLEENGVPVEDVEVAAGGRSATILAIDASATMRGRAIVDAMAAARAFAERRRPDQPLGVVFFGRDPGMALRPTTDAVAIERVLAEVPKVGGAVQDATEVALNTLSGVEMDTASIVILSDGTDLSGRVKSLIEPAAFVDRANADRVRLFTVGLRSRNFNAATLQTLAQAGGDYAEARSSKDLEGIFARLGDRLASEYTVSYRSGAPLGSKIAVTVSVAGVTGAATAAYEAPSLPVGGRVAASDDSPWRSTAAVVTVAALVSILLGFALLILIRPMPLTVRQRIATFVLPDADEEGIKIRQVSALPILKGADRMLDRLERWERFKLDVELAKFKLSAIRILVLGAVTTLTLTAAFWILLDRPMVALVCLVGIPVGIRATVSYKAMKVRRKFEDQLPDNLQVLASALRAGHSFVGALNLMVTDAPEPSKKEYRRVMHDEQLGVPIEDSLRVVGDRMKCEDVIYIGLIATLQRETGGNTAEVLDKVVETMRERAKIRRLVRTLTVQGRLGGWIVTALPIAMVVFLNLAQPDYMDPMTEKPIGIVILVVAAVMVAIGARSIQKIVDIKV